TFFYASQAIAAGIPHVGLDLGGIDTTYTASILNHAAKPKAAAAFVAFLVSAKGQTLLGQDKGLVAMHRPVIFGNTRTVPEAVQSALHKRLETAQR
ncbi:MAG: substrate-binding domain-containing protein, partial [Sinobacteraceae bacterium]|nr:substrate-binding domain-containing protein [Nevskiaceae bacterium]